MPDQPDILDLIVQNTIKVMTIHPQEKGKWFDTLRLFAAQSHNSRQLTTLLNAVIKLLLGDKIEQLNPLLSREYAACWEQIITATQKPCSLKDEEETDVKQIVLDFLNSSDIGVLRANIEQYTELLLSDVAIDLIDQLIIHYNNEPNVLSILEMKRTLLLHCRQIGIEQSFEGIDKNLLQQKQAGNRSDLPPKYENDLHLAKEAEQRYIKTDDIKELNEACSAWERVLHNSEFASHKQFHIAVLNNSAGTFMRRYLVNGQYGDLQRALSLCKEALQLTPQDSPDRPSLLKNLGTTLIARYNYNRQPKDLEEAIRVSQEAVQLIPLESPDRPGYLNTLGSRLLTRYDLSEQFDDLEDAIHLSQQALQLTSLDSPDRHSHLNNLGNALRKRYDRSGQLDDLEEAISVSQQAVQHTPLDSPDRLSLLHNLRIVLIKRYEHSDQFDDLEEAIRVSQQTVQLTPLDSPDRPMYLNNLSNALRKRYDRSGQLDDLEEAICVSQQAVQLTPLDSPDYPIYLNNLGTELLRRYRRSNRFDDLEEAIRAYQQAVQLTPPDSPDHPSRLDNLGNGLHARYDHSSQLDDLEEVIRLYQHALKLTPLDSSERPSRLNELGIALYTRYTHSGRLDDLEEAIHLYQQTIQLTPQDSPNRHMYLNNLGSGLSTRYDHSGRSDDLEEAICLFRQAHQLSPLDFPKRLMYLSNLGTSLNTRYDHSGLPDDLEEAIHVHQQVIQLTPQDSPDRPMFLNSLGNGLRARYTRSGQLVDLKEAIHLYRQAIQLTPPDSPYCPMYLNNLSIGYHSLYDHSCQFADLEETIHLYRKACQTAQFVSLQLLLGASSNWGNWAFERLEWAEAYEAYEYGVKAITELFKTQLLRQHKEAWLHGAQKLFIQAAYAQARCGNLQEAVVLLENGRARLLTENLAHSLADVEVLETTHKKLVERYRDITGLIQILQVQELNTGRSSNMDFSQTRSLHEISEKMRYTLGNLDAVITDIRRVQGHEDFLKEADFDLILRAAQTTPLVYLAITKVGGLALIVEGSARITPIWLDHIKESNLRDKIYGSAEDNRLAGYLGAYVARRNDPSSQNTLHRWLDALDEMTRYLWDFLMDPLLTQVETHIGFQNLSGLTLIPHGLLGLLPLHAAWCEDSNALCGRRYALDVINISYTPNAVSQLASQGKKDIQPAILLAVDNPDGSLWLSKAEVEAVIEHFPETNVLHLAGKNASHEKVCISLPKAHVLHFSTHGFAGFSKPLNGGLVMAKKETLTLRDILGLKLPQARLAVLSACEVGIPGMKLPDEVIALPTGLVQAGVGGVVASLWSVSEVSTMLLMERFYHLWLKENLAPSEALCRAQQWLRDSNLKELTTHVEQSIPELSVKFSALSARQAQLILFNLKENDLQSYPFAHPFYWAAFGYTGI